MSLINDMLKDLDERQSNQPLINSATGTARTLKPVENNKPRLASMVLGIAVLSLGIMAYAYKTQWWTVEQNSEIVNLATEGPEPTRVFQQSSVPTVSMEDPQSRESVVDIVHATSAEGETLEFVLSNAVAHQLLNDSPQQLQLRLPSTQLATRLPKLKSSAVIDTVDFRQEDGDAVVSLGFREPSRARTYLLSEASGSRLIVELSAVDSDLAVEVTGKQPSVVSKAPEPLQRQAAKTSATESIKEDPSESLFEKSKPKLTPVQLDEKASQKAMQMAAKGNLRRAIVDLRGFIAGAENDLISRATLAKLLLRSGDDKAALALVVEARVQHAENLELQKLHSRILLNQGLLEQALGVMNAISAERLDLEYMALRASLQQRTNAHADAIKSYDLLLAQQGAHPPWLIGQAISLEAQGRTDIAKNNYQRALRVSGIDARLKEYAIARLKQLN